MKVLLYIFAAKYSLTKSIFNYSVSHIHISLVNYFPYFSKTKYEINLLKCNDKYHTLSVPATTGIDFLAKYCIRISRRIFFRLNNCIADCENLRQASIASAR